MTEFPDRADLVIIGGGIIGLASAYRFLQRFPQRSVIVLEKEARVAQHQSGHNSGVLHTGIYYKPGSMRARMCRDGKREMQEFCDRESIPYRICGKVIVATSDEELPRLVGVFERGQANGVACEMIGPGRLYELEPYARGIKAIHVPDAGIVDYRVVCDRLAARIIEMGGQVRLNALVTSIETRSAEIIVHGNRGDVVASLLATCGGLQADRLTAMSGQAPAAPIVPFRGEYYTLQPQAEHLCRTLIYPTPDARFPFLGVHFTRVIGGGVECGPNAVLAFSREGYTLGDLNLRDFTESLFNPRFLRLAWKYWPVGMGEMWRSLSKRAFVRALQKLVPGISAGDLIPAPAGVRAQALGRDGSLVDDFVIQESERVINVGNAPSPAATSSLQIGQTIVDRIAERLTPQ